MVEKFGISQPVRRREDARLVAGGGIYVDDVKLPGQAYTACVRSDCDMPITAEKIWRALRSAATWR